jgi:sulfate adenylyltransferase large subunit
MAAATLPVPASSFEEFLAIEESKDLLRFTTAGSVDDGKSTLIGRLLYDSRNVYDDQLESVTKASVGRNAGAIDFSLLTDGLRAEREQGITIDVAYRYFSTPKRKFIIADTPGHEQFTRNMVTGASTAELAIVLVDARKGLLPQSRRHSYISALLGIPNLAIAVNKMDLVDYDEQVFRQIEADFKDFLAQFDSVKPYFIPISALVGDNVVTPSDRMPWFTGQSLFDYLETVPVGLRSLQSGFRFPVQRVVRPNLDFRGYAGQIVSGAVSAGDTVVALPSGRKTRVKSIVTFDGDLPRAHAPQSVTLTLEDEIDIARGDLIAKADDVPAVASLFDATVVWLNEEPLDLKKRYRLKHTTHQEWADVRTIHHRLNINTLEHEAAETLEMNAIGMLRLETARPLYIDNYQHNRATGAFVLIDPVSNSTVAAGMITSAAEHHGEERTVRRSKGMVTIGERVARHRHRGAVIRLGGRLELAARLERRLFDHGCVVVMFPSWNNAWAPAVERAAMLALVAEADDSEFRIQTADGEVKTELSSLPADDDEAVESIFRVLTKTQIVLPEPEWFESDGI